MGRYQQDAKELLAAVGGLILGFRNCIDSMYLLENGTKTLVQVSQFWSGVDSFLWLIGEAIFHMLPVCICWSVTKKMGTTQSLGIVLGLTLVSGQLLNANSVGVGGLPGILSIQPASMLSFALCMAIAMVVPFVLTVVMGKKKGVQ